MCFVEIHHLAIIGEMFILSIAALAVYWKYIRQNLPLDYPMPSPTRTPRAPSHTQFDNHDESPMSDDGNIAYINSAEIGSEANLGCLLPRSNSDLSYNHPDLKAEDTTSNPDYQYVHLSNDGSIAHI